MTQATPATPPERRVRWGLDDAAVGAVGAILLVLAADWALSHGYLTDPRVVEVLSYLVVWVPLLGSVLVACYLRGSRSLARDFGLRFRPIDLLWGLTIGLLTRVVASLAEIAGYGRLGTGGVTLDAPAHDAWWIVLSLLAPVLIAPLIEELYFRGLVLRAVAAATDARRPVALALASVVSALVFALLHVVDARSGTAILVVGAGTFAFGLAAASVTAITGRLGGAMIAHIVFNGLVVVPALLG
jgi:membrane protease YdiL (CAAX protease family)